MKERLLALLAITERPDPPPGVGSEVETFRASRRYLHYSILAWVPKQIAAFTGLLASLAFFGSFDQPHVRAEGWQRFVEIVDRFKVGILGFSVDLTLILLFFEALAVVAFVTQFFFTGLLLKLSWELRWYLVGEQALRIREGLWFLREQTMTIANIQTMIVRQGPVQRLFGISDLEIHTAGGGSSGESGESEEKKSKFHVGKFRGLENAEVLRDQIRDRLVRHHGAGLGDEDEVEEASEESHETGDLGAVAGELLEEARALRLALAAGVSAEGVDV